MTRNSRRMPKNIDELRGRFALKDSSHAEALLNAWPIKQAFHHYLNRCLSSQRTDVGQLPEWKEVDDYVEELPAILSSKTLAQRVEAECLRSPFELMPHVALFVLRAESFLLSDEGKLFDVASEKYAKKRERGFDRRWRSLDLLSFSVYRHHTSRK